MLKTNSYAINMWLVHHGTARSTLPNMKFQKRNHGLNEVADAMEKKHVRRKGFARNERRPAQKARDNAGNWLFLFISMRAEINMEVAVSGRVFSFS